MLQGEHSAILSTFIKLSFVIKFIVFSIFEWPFYTGFTVFLIGVDNSVDPHQNQVIWFYSVFKKDQSGSAGLRLISQFYFACFDSLRHSP